MASPEQEAEFSMSQLSLHSTDSQSEDWDRSMTMDDSPADTATAKTPRNSVVFPADGSEDTPKGKGGAKRSLSELLRLHAERDTNVKFSTEEASRVADVLGQWINAGSSPYEAEDDFFARSQDDLSVKSKKSHFDGAEGRPRGRSESANEAGARSASASKS